MDEDVGFFLAEETDCPYLPGRRWRNVVAVKPAGLDASEQATLLDQGFRRLSHAAFRPLCAGCQECRSLRIDVRGFRPSKSQRRAWRRNLDLEVEMRAPALDAERRDLMARFLAARYEGPMSAEDDHLEETLFLDTGYTREVSFRREGRLLAVLIHDELPDIGSSVYFYFDPEESRRSLGVYSMLWEITHTRERGATWFHPGYFVADCAAMNYKAAFGPAEVFEGEAWIPFQPSKPRDE
jgi:leucyl-tRNA---protein transferase